MMTDHSKWIRLFYALLVVPFPIVAIVFRHPDIGTIALWYLLIVLVSHECLIFAKDRLWIGFSALSMILCLLSLAFGELERFFAILTIGVLVAIVFRLIAQSVKTNGSTS